MTKTKDIKTEQIIEAEQIKHCRKMIKIDDILQATLTVILALLVIAFVGVVAYSLFVIN